MPSSVQRRLSVISIEELLHLNGSAVNGRVYTLPVPGITKNWSDNMSDALHDFAGNVRFVFRRMWTWWETYLIMFCFLVLFSVVVGGSAKQEIIKGLENQIEVIKIQNDNSIKDRNYLHEELKNTRESLHRLESKVRTEDLH
jgi:hypothetical protein